MNHWRRIAALCGAAMLLLAGCGEKEPDFSKESELPYGATMRSDQEGYSVPMTWDRRFVETEQVAAVADFMAALQSQDAAGYKRITPAGYADYQMEVYELTDTDALMERLHSVFAAASGDDYQYTMVLINGMNGDKGSTGLSNALALMEGIYQGEESFAVGVQGAWDFTVELDMSYDNGSSYAVLDEQHVYVFRTADGCYCMM